MAPLTDVETLVAGETVTRIERILRPVDFSEVSAKTYHLCAVDRHNLATLIVQHIVELELYPSTLYTASLEVFELRRNLIGNGQTELQQFVNTGGGVQPERTVQYGLAADAILTLARERTISLIVWEPTAGAASIA